MNLEHHFYHFIVYIVSKSIMKNSLFIANFLLCNYFMYYLLPVIVTLSWDDNRHEDLRVERLSGLQGQGRG